MNEYHLSGFRIAYKWLRCKENFSARQGRSLGEPVGDGVQWFLASKEAEDPLGEFCLICQQEGYDIYPIDIIQTGDEFYATMKRSTNGGGENSPVLTCEDDAYELFFAGLETDN